MGHPFAPPLPRDVSPATPGRSEAEVARATYAPLHSAAVAPSAPQGPFAEGCRRRVGPTHLRKGLAQVCSRRSTTHGNHNAQNNRSRPFAVQSAPLSMGPKGPTETYDGKQRAFQSKLRVLRGNR